MADKKSSLLKVLVGQTHLAHVASSHLSHISLLRISLSKSIHYNDNITLSVDDQYLPQWPPRLNGAHGGEGDPVQAD
jgi:hypothetical protein